MPYIKAEKRKYIDAHIQGLLTEVHGVGSINYAITKLLHSIIERDGLSYTLINGLIGVLICVKLELFRMIGAKYEDKKRAENGPVSDLDARSLEDVR